MLTEIIASRTPRELTAIKQVYEEGACLARFSLRGPRCPFSRSESGPVRGSRRRAVGEGQVNEGGNEQAIP